MIDTDYLVVGAGASGMAFVDAVLANSSARVVLVDRRHRPGGHWRDAYPFVRLHQPSANYGVASRTLGADRIDATGPNSGFYERATAEDICAYYDAVMAQFVESGRVGFLGMHDYLGPDGDGHEVVSLLTGTTTTIRARRLVDATYIESEIPSRRPPTYDIDPGVRVIPPNELVNLGAAPGGFTIVGAGKTAMDTCVWLLDAGVDPDRVRWIRSRDPWMFARKYMQPLELVADYMEMQARWVDAAAATTGGADFALRLEESGVLTRIDDAVEPTVFRGPVISEPELDALRSIEHVVRRGYVRRVATDRIVLADGEEQSRADEVYVDCTAAGVRPSRRIPVFAPERITLQLTTFGIVPWSTATIGFIETSRADDAEKNRLCPPVAFSGNVSDLLELAHPVMVGLMARGQEPDVAAWTETCRLNPAMGAVSRASEPAIGSAFTRMATNIGAALTNLAARVPPET